MNWKKCCNDGTDPRDGQTWASGTVRAEVKGNYYPPPEFPVKVFANWSDVQANFFIVGQVAGSSRVSAIEPARLDSILERVNQVYRQAGMRFISGSVNQLPTAFDKYFVLNEDSTDPNDLIKGVSISSGLKVIIVNSIVNNTGQEGSNGINYSLSNGDQIGIIFDADRLDSDAVGKTLAHEVGHTCGLDDIYVEKGSKAVGDEKAKYEWGVKDWPAEEGFYCDPSYYSRLVPGYNAAQTWLDYGYAGGIQAPDMINDLDAYATRQSFLIRVLIMCGRSYDNGTGKKLDIPIGKVYGVYGGYSHQALGIGEVKVGLDDLNRFPYHINW
jgi:hypothetical protein